MSIEFHCSCGQKIAVPDQMGGKKGKCPACGMILNVPPDSGAAPDPPAANEPDFGPVSAPEPSPAVDQVVPEDGPPSEFKDCKFCGEQIKSAAKKCRYCGEFLDGSARLASRPGAHRRADAATRGASGKVRRANDAANLSLVFGIIPLVIPCPLLCVGAIVKGNEARRLAQSAGIETPGAATAGLVLGWLGVVATLLLFGLFAFLLVVGIAVSP